MSRIYFHSESEGTLAISGRERAHFGGICSRMLLASMGPLLDLHESPHWLRLMLPPDHYLHRSRRFETDADVWLSVGRESLVVPGSGERLDPFTLALNSTCSLGGDVTRLIARIHGQCELHAYVEGRNRAWLAELIEQGMRIGLFRSGMGWEALVPWLRASSSAPVVTSYSVCEQFPPTDTRTDERIAWDAAMYQLRTAGGDLEMTPDRWAWPDFHFGQYAVTGCHLELLATGELKLADLMDKGDG